MCVCVVYVYVYVYACVHTYMTHAHVTHMEDNYRHSFSLSLEILGIELWSSSLAADACK